MTADNVKSAQNAVPPDARSVSPPDRDRQPEKLNTVKLQRHIDVGNPSDSLVKPPSSVGRNVVPEPTGPEQDAGLKSLRRWQVAKTTCKWAAPAMLVDSSRAAADSNSVFFMMFVSPVFVSKPRGS